MSSRPSVLIVDQQEETHEVLRTALEPRGMRILSASRASAGLALAKAHRPDLIVLDLESGSGGSEPTARSFAAEQGADAPLVVLGTLRRRHPLADGQEFVAKPYHYATLIRKIEELLAESPGEARPAPREPLRAPSA